MKRGIVAAAAVGLLLVPALPILGHVGVAPDEVTPEGSQRLAFTIGHGCDGSPTNRVTIEIPEQVTSARPQPKPGWELSVEGADGAVSSVTWQGGTLPDGQFDEFVISVAFEGEEGQSVYFPVVQGCEDGEHRWIQIPAEGEDAHELPEPAPGVLLTATEDSDADGSADSLTIVALVLGGAGLLMGSLALMNNRR